MQSFYTCIVSMRCCYFNTSKSASDLLCVTWVRIESIQPSLPAGQTRYTNPLSASLSRPTSSSVLDCTGPTRTIPPDSSNPNRSVTLMA